MRNATAAFDLNEVELSSSVTIARYREMEAKKDRDGLAHFVEERLSERYVDPLQASPKKHGFLMMAAACLLIETLESFYRGWPDTSAGIPRGQIEDPCKPTDPKRTTVSAGEVALCYFFQRESALATFQPHAHDFYAFIRCGILHQGETNGGWHVERKGDLFDVPNLTINAKKFLEIVRRAISTYADALRKADWDGNLWKNFRGKMNAIIEHCER